MQFLRKRWTTKVGQVPWRAGYPIGVGKVLPNDSFFCVIAIVVGVMLWDPNFMAKVVLCRSQSKAENKKLESVLSEADVTN